MKVSTSVLYRHCFSTFKKKNYLVFFVVDVESRYFLLDSVLRVPLNVGLVKRVLIGVRGVNDGGMKGGEEKIRGE